MMMINEDQESLVSIGESTPPLGNNIEDTTHTLKTLKTYFVLEKKLRRNNIPHSYIFSFLHPLYSLDFSINMILIINHIVLTLKI